MTQFFRLQSPEGEWCMPSRSWTITATRQGLLCIDCGRVLSSRYPTPIDVQYNRAMRDCHVLETSVANLALIRQDVLQALSPYCDDLAVGAALDNNGAISTTHRVGLPNPRLIVTERDVRPIRKIVVCPTCNTIRVYAGSEEPGYLLSYEIGDRDCVFDRIGSIYVSDRIAKALPVKSLRPLILQEFDVRDEPLDGLRYPTDPPWVKGRDASKNWSGE